MHTISRLIENLFGMLKWQLKNYLRFAWRLGGPSIFEIKIGRDTQS
jgi:hypothetical protein